MKHTFPIGPPDDGRRVDRYLQSALGVPMSLVQRLLRQGKVRVNGTKVKGPHRLAAGDELVAHHAKAPATRPRAAVPDYTGPELDVLHRDDRYLVVAKPAGISCSVDDRPERSLEAWLARTLADETAQGEVRAEVCHRLDVGTTGVVVVALTAPAVTAFHRTLDAPDTQKEYLALCWGRPQDGEFTVDTALARLPHAGRGRPKVVPAPSKGQEARTDFRVLAVTDNLTLLRAFPRTGRTHQIRAHLLDAELPLVGDPRYGTPDRDRLFKMEVDHQLLHAERFLAPSLELDVRAPLPPEWTRVLKRFGLADSL